MKTYSTEKAAEKIGVTRITLQRWLAKGFRPSIAIPFAGRTFWRWTDWDIRRAKEMRKTLKPGPKKKAKKKR